jgi:DNA-binding CsgD family transcriptional regulator
MPTSAYYHELFAGDTPTVRRVLDAFAEAYVVFSGSGVRLHTSHAATKLFGTLRDHERLWSEMSQLAMSAIANGRSVHAFDGEPKAIQPMLPGQLELHVRLARCGVEVHAIVVVRLRSGSAGETGALNMFGLTARETEVARWIATGRPTKEVAKILGISTHTARRHLERIHAKLGVRNRAEVILAITNATAPLPRSA